MFFKKNLEWCLKIYFPKIFATPIFVTQIFAPNIYDKSTEGVGIGLVLGLGLGQFLLPQAIIYSGV